MDRQPSGRTNSLPTSSFSIKSDNDYPGVPTTALELASDISAITLSLLPVSVTIPSQILTSALNDLASSPLQSTKDAVNGISRLRRHHETTIFERHKSHVDESRPSDDECKQLKKWCEKLVGQTKCAPDLAFHPSCDFNE